MGRYTCDVCFISHDNYWIWNDIYDACSYECLMSWKNKMNPQQKDAHQHTVQNGGDTIEKVSSSSPSPSPSPSPPSSSSSSSPIASTTQKELKEENDKLKAQLRKFENSTTSLKNNISDLQAQVKKLTDEKAVIENNNNNLQGQLKKLEESKAAMEIELKKQMSEIQSDLKQTREDKLKSIKQRDNLQSQLNEIEKGKIESKEEIEGLKAQLKAQFDGVECNIDKNNKSFFVQKKKYPCLTLTKGWGFGKNPMCSPESMNLQVGEQVFLIQHDEPWFKISHPDKGQAWVHNSCFDILEVGSIWRHPDNSYARPGDIELKQGERVVICEKHGNNWWKVFHLEKCEELLVHCSIFP